MARLHFDARAARAPAESAGAARGQTCPMIDADTCGFSQIRRPSGSFPAPGRSA